jgi:hypothetical protein
MDCLIQRDPNYLLLPRPLIIPEDGNGSSFRNDVFGRNQEDGYAQKNSSV